MEFMILIYNDEGAWARFSDGELKTAYAEYTTYTQELIAAGVLRGGSELQPVSTAVTISMRAGKMRRTDGPYAETKEQLGGYYLIDVDSVDAAAKWAAKCPGASHGFCEVRPLNPSSPPG